MNRDEIIEKVLAVIKKMTDALPEEDFEFIQVMLIAGTTESSCQNFMLEGEICPTIFKLNMIKLMLDMDQKLFPKESETANDPHLPI